MSGVLLDRWRNLSLKVKTVLTFLAVSILPILFLGLFSNYEYSKAVEREFNIVSGETNELLNYHLDYYFGQLRQSTYSLIQNDTIQDWLISPDYSNSDIQDVEKELRSYLALNYSEIKGMFLLSRTKPIVSMAQSFAKLDGFTQEPWYNLPLSDTLKIIPTHTAQYEGANGMTVMSVEIPIYNKRTLDLIGNLVIDISLEELDRSLAGSKLGSLGYFFILSDDDLIIYHPRSQWNGQLRKNTEMRQLTIPNTDHAMKERLNGVEYLLSSSRSSVTGWRIVTLASFNELASGLSSARMSMFILLGFITLFVLVVVPIMTNRFVRPILTLRGIMKQVAKGDLSVRVDDVPRQEELQQLFHSFNFMVNQLNELIATNYNLRLKDMQTELLQKTAMIKALQNQINPHLLYNTLGIIQSMAYLEEVPLIEKMARNLADFYRYTANIAQMEVTLAEETRQLEKYLEMIRIRFPVHFQSKLYISEKYLPCPVLKFILQPIAENAVKYAVEPRGGEGVVIVSAYDENEVMVIEVADNGPGIDEEELRELREVLTTISSRANESYALQESLGIPNVHARLVLKYGSEYGVSVDSFPGRGTVVSLRIPLHEVGSPFQED